MSLMLYPRPYPCDGVIRESICVVPVIELFTLMFGTGHFLTYFIFCWCFRTMNCLRISDPDQPSRYDYDAYEKFMNEGDFFKYLPPSLQFPILDSFLKYVYPPEPGRSYIDRCIRACTVCIFIVFFCVYSWARSFVFILC